jgi:serine/threonine protein kinase
VAIVVLRGIWDLHERGFFYCDLRPGNVRIRGRSEHRVRLMDAGSLVPRDHPGGEFPHVPAYLPPELFLRAEIEGTEALVPSLAAQAVMAGRTLFEVATGKVPVPGEPIDVSLLRRDTVSPSVASTIEGLCIGAFPDVLRALGHLAKAANRAREAARSVARAPQPVAAGARRDLAGALSAARSSFRPAPPMGVVRRALAATAWKNPARMVPPKPRAAPTVHANHAILPPRRRKSWWRRLVERLSRL